MIRDTIPLPPKKWRPPQLRIAVKREILARQQGACANTGEILPPLGQGLVHFDHRPPVHEREWSEKTGDTIPPANHPDFIFAILRDGPGGHREVTGADNSRMGKTRRLREAQAALNEVLQRPCGQKRKPKGTIKSRGFEKGAKRPAWPKRPMSKRKKGERHADE